MGSESSFCSDVRSFGQSHYFQYHEKRSVIIFLIVGKKQYLTLTAGSFQIQEVISIGNLSLDLSCSASGGESEDSVLDHSCF
jgi:hypothetical protein